MLVCSMTPKEKVQELKHDYMELMPSINAWAVAFSKEVKKIKNIQWMIGSLEKHKICKTRNGNEWHIYYRIKHGYCVSNSIIPLNGPQLHLLTYLSNPAAPIVREYTPHFMKRYSERFLQPQGINRSGIEALAYFESRTINRVLYTDEDDKTIYSISDDGFMISEDLKCMELMKTFIARDEELSKNKVHFTNQVVSLMMFYRYLLTHQRKLTFPAVFEELKKVKLMEENIINAFEAKFRNCQRLNCDDVLTFIHNVAKENEEAKR